MTDTGDLTGPTSTGVDARLSALLCYLAWWVSGVVFLVLEQEHRAVRFHAAQSIVLFGGFSAVMMLLAVLNVAALVMLPALFDVTRIILYVVSLAAVVLWLAVLLKTLRGESWSVPFAGDLAARIASR